MIGQFIIHYSAPEPCISTECRAFLACATAAYNAAMEISHLLAAHVAAMQGCLNASLSPDPDATFCLGLICLFNQQRSESICLVLSYGVYEKRMHIVSLVLDHFLINSSTIPISAVQICLDSLRHSDFPCLPGYDYRLKVLAY